MSKFVNNSIQVSLKIPCRINPELAQNLNKYTKENSGVL